MLSKARQCQRIPPWSGNTHRSRVRDHLPNVLVHMRQHPKVGSPDGRHLTKEVSLPG